jgi:predicted esterase
MRRILLLPLALAASAAVVATGVPAAASPAQTLRASPPPPPPTRDLTKIAQAERAAHASGTRSPRATTGSSSFMQDTYAVGKTLGFTVNRARGVQARYPAPASSVRNLAIEIWYPAVNAPKRSSDTFWATALGGHFPLVVFAAGFNANPDTYQPFLHAIAAQGFIVAAPVFPIEASISGSAPAQRSNAEILNQMYDMSAVITQMQAYAKERGNFLATAMNPNKVGVIGHSDGAMTVAGMTMSTSYNDPRIDAAIVMAGAGPFGLTWNNRKVVPTMVEQATRDPYNEPSNSTWLFNHVRGSRDYLSVNGPYHIWPLIGNDATADFVRRAVVTQLSAQLSNGGWLAFWGLVWAANQPGITSLLFAT